MDKRKRFMFIGRGTLIQLFALSWGMLLCALPTWADQVIADNLEVQGSVCVGFDCVNGEVFGADTLRLKENNTRILFMDTSTAAGEASTDWFMQANDSSLGGSSTFQIKDVEGVADPNLQGTPVLAIQSGNGGGVALGANSTLSAGTVSVGSAGSERRITNVADATNATDAINLSQLNRQHQQLWAEISVLDERTDRIVAMSAAVAALVPNGRISSSNQFSVGVGAYHSVAALAIGYFRSLGNNWLLNAGLGWSGSQETTVKTGLTYAW